MALHLTYIPDLTLLERLDRWEAEVRRAPDLSDDNWRMLVVWEAARNASVSGSTGIEGNPLGPAEVGVVLSGAALAADDAHIREVANYNAALELGRAAVSRPDFEWTHEIIHQVNAAVMHGLARDTLGDYRTGDEEVHVGIYTGPSPAVVHPLMTQLVDWLRGSSGVSTLVRSALLHLNLIAIHPFIDGNGRTARIVAALALLERGIQASDLISVEAYLRRNRDEYVDELRTTLGYGYDPENHPVTGWLDYYTRVSLDRLEARNRLLDALPGDVGVLFAALSDAGDPGDWAPLLLAARVSGLRTTRVARMTVRSDPAARALLAQMVRRGWLLPEGRTRARRYLPSGRLDTLALRTPRLMRLLAGGDQLALFDED